tara:strand:- start:18 stop:644 length:627 start_codon:yes stop_codon:yes gene_type:complete
MLDKKELSAIGIITLILAFVFSFTGTVDTFFYFLVMIFFVIMLNIFSKKISSYYLDSEIEVKFWEIKRFGFKPNRHFKRAFPSGILFPLITAAASLGYFIWMASLVFDVKPKVYRAAKRFGLYSFSEMAEWHIGLIAASGVLINLIFGVLGYFIGFSDFARLNIYYAFFNMIPLSDLDGNKIFFGSFVLWSFLAALVLIGIGYVFLIV